MPGPFAHLTDPLGPALLAGTALAAPGLTAPPTVQVAPPPAAPQAAAQAEADDPDAAAEKPKGKARKAKKAKVGNRVGITLHGNEKGAGNIS